MPPKNNVSKVISKVVYRPGDSKVERGEETEIAAQISVPQEGGWGWVVVLASFTSIFILDGVIYTFGTLLNDISSDLRVAKSLVALLNSVQTALYFMTSPLASAIINRFGFRASIMTGSMITSFSLLASYFSANYAALILFYGIISGFGCSLINMAASLVVGFYFEKRRAIALSLTTVGSSFGVMAMFPLNTVLVRVTDWRTTTLLHSGMLGIIFFLGLTYRPLLSLTVMVTEEEDVNPTRTVTFLPNLAGGGAADGHDEAAGPRVNPAERLFNAVSNVHFPTAFDVVGDKSSQTATPTQPSTSTAPFTSKFTLKASSPRGGISRQQLKQVQSMASRPDLQNRIRINVQTDIARHEERSCFGRCCHWEEHTEEARPIYRDDIFYNGKLEKLAAYQKSVMEVSPEERTGLEYQLAVSRAVTVNDLRDKKGLCTTALRRVLASMLDPTLLKKYSFIVICCSGFLTHIGFLVPYVFLPDRNEQAGIDVIHCSLFVSVLSLGSMFGRLIFGVLANYLDPIKIYGCSIMVAGVSTVASGLSYSLYYQYFYCSMFGIFISAAGGLRSIMLVSLYGLDKLTNATGMLLVFLGLGNLFSTPIACILKEKYGYDISFYVSGTFIALSGLIMLFVRMIVTKEQINDAQMKENKQV